MSILLKSDTTSLAWTIPPSLNKSELFNQIMGKFRSFSVIYYSDSHSLTQKVFIEVPSMTVNHRQGEDIHSGTLLAQ